MLIKCQTFHVIIFHVGLNVKKLQNASTQRQRGVIKATRFVNIRVMEKWVFQSALWKNIYLNNLI